MNHIIIIFCLVVISGNIYTSFASDSKTHLVDIRLVDIKNDNGSEPTTSANSYCSSSNDVNQSQNNLNQKKNTHKGSLKFAYFYHKDDIEKNIAEFNSILYKGEDLLQASPHGKDVSIMRSVKYYSIISAISIVVAVAATISVVGATKLIESKEKFLEELRQKLLNNLSFFDKHQIQQITDSIITPNFNNPNNYNIRKNFIYLFVGVATLFSTMNYNVLNYIANIFYLKKYRNFIYSRSFLSIICKFGITMTVSSLYLYGIKDNINTTLQDMNNIAHGYSLDHENKLIKILGDIFCGGAGFIFSCIACFPIIDLLVNTVSEGINTCARKRVNFNETPLPEYIHKLVDSEKITNLSKKVIINLLTNNFNQQDNIQIKKTLQLVRFNPSETINLAGVLNNFTKINLRYTKYSLDDKSYNKQFVSGVIKLAVIAGTTFILVKIGNNLYNDMIVAETLISTDAILYLEGVYHVDLLVKHLNFTIDKKDLSSYLISNLRPRILNTIEDNNNNLGLATQLAIYSATGILYMILDTSEALYVIFKHCGKYYRGPTVLISSLLSFVVPILIALDLYSYFDNEIPTLEKSEQTQRLIGIDTSVLGINSVRTKLNVVKAALTFGILQYYKYFIPFSTFTVLKLKDLFSYLAHRAMYYCQDS